MFCFKSRIKLPELFYSVRSSFVVQSLENDFFSFKAGKIPTEDFLFSFNCNTVKDTEKFFGFKITQNVFDFPFFSFKPSLKIENLEHEKIFEQFDSYFLTENMQFILDVFDSYFYYFYSQETQKESLLLGRFLTFLVKENINDLISFEEKFRLFKGA